MILLRVEEQQLKPDTLARLAQMGPVIVTREDMPVFVVQEATPEWLEAWAAELDESGDMELEAYARIHNLTVDIEAYRQEFPEDALFTLPPAEAGN